MSESAIHGATEAAQAKVLRRLYLRLMFRARLRNRNRRALQDPRLTFAGSLLLFGLVGLLAIGMRHYDLLVLASMLHALTFLLMTMNLATTSGNLLFSPDEADALLHRPVRPRALLSAKVRVIVMVSLALALFQNLCGIYEGATLSEGGWRFIPAHVFSVTLEVIFCASLVVLAYNLCLKWFGRERLDNLMTSVQVTVAVVTMVGAQLVPRLLPTLNADQIAAHPPLWLAALPPVWFGALDHLLTRGFTSVGLLGLATIGVAATVLTAWLGVTRLAETYARGLMTLNEAAPEPGPGAERGRWAERLLHLPIIRTWLRDPVERAAFRVTLANVTRARGVKLRVYPALAQFLIYPVVMLVSMGSGKHGEMIPFGIAMGGAFIALLPATVLETLRYAEDFAAADLFRFAPLEKPAALFQGTRKAVVAVLCGPGLIAIALLELVWLRQPAMLLLLLPGALSIPVISLFPAIGRGFLPFAQPADVQAQNSGRILLTMISLMAAFALAGVAALAWSFGYFWWVIAAEGVAVPLVAWVCRRLVDRGTSAAIRE